MSALTASPHDLMRRALVAMDESFVLEVVDSMQLTGVKLPAVVAVAVPVVRWFTTTPLARQLNPTVAALLQLVKYPLLNCVLVKSTSSPGP